MRTTSGVREKSSSKGLVDKLEYVFDPGSVAFVGATQAKVKWGFIVLNNLISGDYQGKIYPVNPAHGEIMGLRCYQSVAEIPAYIDTAIFTVPAAAIPESLAECARKGVKAAIVISAGFKELGGSGEDLEKEMVSIARKAGIALVGPNGQGVCCPSNNFYPWMPLFYPPKGPIGFVCQSGNILNMTIGHALDSGFGVSKAVSSGNEAMLKKEDFFHYLGGDPQTEVIVSYVEGVEDGRRFLGLSREVTLSKPIVLLKGGRTSSGVSAARSHTGAMAVSDRLFEDACSQAGIILVDTVEEAGVTASSFVGRPLPRGNRVGIITGGGGLGVLAADACSDNGLEVARLSDQTLSRVGRHLPEYWVPGNPIDLVAGLDLSVIKPILEILMKSGEVDSVLLIFIESPRSKGLNLQETGGRGLDLSMVWDAVTSEVVVQLEDMHEVMWDLGLPIYVACNFDEFLPEDRKPQPGKTRTMMYSKVVAACRAMGAMVRYQAYRESHSG